jgi:diguanylate cyclase (GGDEF)-like protein
MTFLRRATLRAKASVASGIALAFVLTIGILGLVALQQVNGATKEIRNFWVPKIEVLDDLKRAAGATAGLATARIQTNSFRQIADLDKRLAANRATLASSERALKAVLRSEAERQLAIKFGEHWAEFDSEFRSALQAIEAGAAASAQARFMGVATLAAAQAERALDELIDYSKQRMNHQVDRAERVYSFAILITLGALLIGVGLSGAVILWTSRQVTSPIVAVSDAMRRLTAGDYSVKISPQSNRKDEIGTLIEAVEGYRESLILSKRLADEVAAERERLQAAVGNMPIGLCMFDANDNLIICNRRYEEMYNLPAEMTRAGAPIRDIVAHRMKGAKDGLTAEQYIHDVLAAMQEGEGPTHHIVELDDGRTLSIINQPLPGGGGIGTHEDITDRRRAEERIRHMARHDGLTDLPNRILFKERVEEGLKRLPRDNGIAVICLDLDHFKAVNDTLGHPIGDGLLKQVADRLRATVREQDTIGRFGGDEFAIVQIGTTQPEDVTALAQRVVETLSEPYEVDGHQAVIGVSIGIAVAPTDGESAEQLLKNADMALYRAKSDGRGSYRFFEPDMDARMQARRTLECDLRRALIRQEFELYYQPTIDVRTKSIVGFEALLRWHHPERGLIPPAEFIPLAEEIGIIVPLGEWVLRQACKDAALWPNDIKVAVNLSPAQFKGKKVLDAVITALASSGLSAKRLELEITEGVLMTAHEGTLEVLHQLRAFGVKIAMDDFGTGYSSLSYLRSFPFDKIKIDSSFIRNVNDEESSLAIIRAVTGLSASLGMATTAEGVETQEQFDRVSAEGCGEVQGFFFSKAVPVGELRDLMDKLDREKAAA